MNTNQNPTKFTREFGTYTSGESRGSCHFLVLASAGYPDIMIRPNLTDGYAVVRRGDDDIIALFRTQREAKAYAVGARAVDQAG